MSGAGGPIAAGGTAGGGAGGAGGDAVAVTVNGEERRLPRGLTVASLLDVLGTDQRGVAVAVDGEVVSRSGWEARELVGGEHVEILSVARGG